VEVGRRIHHRISTWILNKTARTLHTTSYIVLGYLITGYFLIGAFEMLLFVFLFDFVTIALATDNVRYLGTPSKWEVFKLVRGAVAVGLLILCEQFAFLAIAVNVFELDYSTTISTISFQLLFYFAILTTFSVRERTHFWVSRPGTPLLVALIVEVVGVVIVCTTGVPGLNKLVWWQNFACLGYCVVLVFTLNDLVKCLVFKWMHILHEQPAVPDQLKSIEAQGLAHVTAKTPLKTPLSVALTAPTHPSPFTLTPTAVPATATPATAAPAAPASTTITVQPH